MLLLGSEINFHINEKTLCACFDNNTVLKLQLFGFKKLEQTEVVLLRIDCNMEMSMKMYINCGKNIYLFNHLIEDLVMTRRIYFHGKDMY